MRQNINIDRSYNLTRLKRYLNYEVSGTILYVLSFQVFIFIFLAAAVALIFMPFMLYVLYTEKKKGWIILFVLIVVVPFVILLVTGLIFEFSKPLLMIVLGLFYFYCFLLRFEANDWVKESNARSYKSTEL